MDGFVPMLNGWTPTTGEWIACGLLFLVGLAGLWIARDKPQL